MSLSANYLASYFLPSFNKRNYVKRVSKDCHGLLSPKKGDFENDLRKIIAAVYTSLHPTYPTQDR